MSGPYDALIIGAGHNGLTCACYLAAAGLRVRVLERRHIVGGAAVTEEFHPGFRNSVASYTVSLLNPKVIGDLRLASHGLRIVERPFSNFLPLDDNNCLRVGGGIEATQEEVARFSKRDAEKLPAYYESIERVAAILRDTVLQTPPNLGGGLIDLWRALKLGNSLRGLDIETQRDLHALFTKSAGDMLDAWFESAPIKAALGFDSVVGNYASPYTPGSAYVLLHHCFGEVNGKRGIWGHAIGGMGAITQAMATEAKARGVEISTSCTVESVLMRKGHAVGVALSDGTSIAARRIVSNLNPKLLFEKLVDPELLDEDFRRRIAGWKCGSGTLRMNVALSELPDFRCMPGKTAQPHHSSGIIMAPSLQYMDQAWRDAQQFGWSREPIVEMLIPSTVDDSLAPRGMHVASLFCQQFAPETDWDTHREEAADRVIDTVNRYAPNFKNAIIARQVLTPLDLERVFGLTGGDIFHGALSLDQLFSARPVLGYADYRSPIPDLYLCGSGTHPGGGVTGAPGHNAAQEIIRDWRKQK